MARRLPPLNALKAFEAGARFGGFVPAAQELGVTPGAVSQQIKNLEEFFGTKLFVRRNNRLHLTDAGLAVYSESADIMDRLSEMTQRMLHGEVRSRLVISVLHSPGLHWINRQLPEFLRLEPELRCEIRIESDPVDFAKHHIDARICYGDHLYPELETTPLIRDRVTPLATPELAAARGLANDRPDALEDRDLIHTIWAGSYASNPSWHDWFVAAGSQRRPRMELGHKVEMPSLAIDLAVAGVGIVLGQRLLAQDELAAGSLVAPFATSVPLGYPYCVVTQRTKSGKKSVAAFIDWLKGKV
jgi:LysR family glycine cleavage system transcriptional activator